MVRKNTLVTIDEHLVEMAKKAKLNISRIAEESLRSHLFPYLSLSEKIALDFSKFLKDLEREGNCFYISFRIKKIKIENIGPIKRFDFDFENRTKRFGNNVFVFYGHNGVGKTALLRAIAAVFGHKIGTEENIIHQGTNNGKVEIEYIPKNKVTYNFRNGIKANNYECILIDEAEPRLNGELYKKFIEYLKGTGKQIIMTGLTDGPRASISKTRWIELHKQV